MDNDGDLDFVLGNWGENSVFSATADRPINMYVKDFDNNGKSEFIIETYFDSEDQAFPFASKMDLTSQLPHLKDRILKYKDYAKNGYKDLLSASERKRASKFTTITLKSSILWNDTSGYRLQALPKEAQISPIYAILAEDLDSDSNLDLLLLGNCYGTKPEVGRQDANIGVVLKGDGQGEFSEIPQAQSGIRIKGEVRDVVSIKNSRNQSLILVGRNNDSMLTFRKADKPVRNNN